MRSSLNRVRKWLMCVACLACALCVAPTAAAGDVRFQMPEGDVYAGVPFVLTIRVVDASDRQPPKLPEIAGATARVSIPETRSSSMIRNGRRVDTYTTRYEVEITPDKAGRLEIPPISIVVDGTEYKSQSTYVDVKKGEAGLVFDAEVFGTPPEVYIGQPLELVLRIGIKPFRDPTYGTLNESQMWHFVDLPNSEWGIFGAGLQRLAQEGREMPRAQTEQRNGTAWYVYEISRTIWPPKSGKPDLGNILLRMKYPVGLREVDGFFSSQLVVSGSRPLAATATVNPLTVLSLPSEGKPDGFTGAVGQFSMTATAKPLSVAVGDPISLTLTVIDRTPSGANLDTLQPPDLAANAGLKKDFRIPNEPLSGTASTSRKTFVQSIRPLRADITAIPAIPFSYFDPAAREYRTVTSDPIPITVTPASQMDLSRIERANGGESTETAGPTTHLTEVEAGLMANKPVTPRLLADERLRLSTATIAALAVPPVAVGAAALWRLNRSRHERDSGLARRSRARRTAQRRLEEAADAAGVARAVAGFVEDRLGRAEGTMTRGDLHTALTAHGVPDAERTAVTGLLADCDRAVYAAGGATGAKGGELLTALRSRAAQVLDSLDHVAWSRSRGAAA